MLHFRHAYPTTVFSICIAATRPLLRESVPSFTSPISPFDPYTTVPSLLWVKAGEVRVAAANADVGSLQITLLTGPGADESRCTSRI